MDEVVYKEYVVKVVVFEWEFFCVFFDEFYMRFFFFCKFFCFF